MYKFDPNYDAEQHRKSRYPSWVIVAKGNDPLPVYESASFQLPVALARSVHCYTDACVCYKTGVAAGAYVIGTSSPVAFVVDAADSNTAELLAMIACLKAVESSREFPITLHIDLPHIAHILAKPKRDAARAELRVIVERLGVHIVADGRRHTAYRLCHRAAGVMAGKHGWRHPQFVGSTETVNRQILRDREKQSENDRLIQSQLDAARLRAKQIKLKGGLCGVHK